MIKAIIFDLDSCLSAADEPGRELFAGAFAAIERANKRACGSAALHQAFEDMWRFPFDAVAQQYGFTREMRSAGWEVLKQVEVTTPMKGYGDLSAIEALPADKYLVTSGFRRLQESKVRALGIGPLLAGVYIDAIDEPGQRGKQTVFAEILREHRLQPAEVLVVGDNPDSEIAAGRNLGMTTVQILRPGVGRGDNADHYIHSLHELQGIIENLEQGA